MAALPLDHIRDQFPILKQAGAPAYLDSAATSQKPQVVIDRLQRYYAQENANVHRGIYALSEAATREFEDARQEAARFLQAEHVEETIFTRGTTEAINLVAQCFASQLQPGDEILLSVAEHHSNIVPWQMVAERYQLNIKYIPLTPEMRLDLDAARQLVTGRTKILSIAHISNVLGVIHPIEELIQMAHQVGAKVMIDGAQGAVHLPIDVQKLDCDFYAFSGHKVCGPTGIGVLYGKKDLLNAMPPYQGGGDMIEQVSLKGSTWNQLPSKFEAGTPNIAGAIGLAEALRFLQSLPRKEALQHEQALGRQILEVLAGSRAKALITAGDDWVGIVPFYHPDIHPHDLASICDSENVCIRAGHHCAQPLMEYLGVSATARLSPYIYNTTADIEQFARALAKAEKLFC
ncbi:MAG: aminotransferase class V-fold PLP-dependent enzyme [Oligoflexus sp.]